jgi:hypothetical protein
MLSEYDKGVRGKYAKCLIAREAAKELQQLRKKRRHATDGIHRLRKRIATLSGKEIVDAVRQDRASASH